MVDGFFFRDAVVGGVVSVCLEGGFRDAVVVRIRIYGICGMFRIGLVGIRLFVRIRICGIYRIFRIVWVG